LGVLHPICFGLDVICRVVLFATVYLEEEFANEPLMLLVINLTASHTLNRSASLVSICYGGVPTRMIDVLMWLLWFIFGAYSFWFVTRAKRPQPLTLDELVILWKIHKQQARCAAPLSRVKPVIDSHTNEFSGFTCECGYQYVSKRLILQKRALDQNMFFAKSFGSAERSQLLKT